MTSTALTPSSAPTKLPDERNVLEDMASEKELRGIAVWVQGEFERARQARSRQQSQWYTNLSFFHGKQYVVPTSSSNPDGFRDKLITPKTPYYRDPKTVNRTRAFVRAEHSRFLSEEPVAAAVPATSEDQDVRAAYAAEQAWQSMSHTRRFYQHYGKAAWWMILTGNGFMKTTYDTTAVDKVSGQHGDIMFSSVSPFHLFVPDLREQDIEDQPFVLNAYVKPIEWCERFFGEELKGKKLTPTASSGNQILDSGHLNLAGGNQLDSCVVYEAWIKPGATKLLPEGGMVVTIDDNVVGISRDGIPYTHGEFPFTKFEHTASGTFYATSPLEDTNELQKEYNQLRSEVSEAGRRMSKPQLLVQKGSVVVSKITNEPGLAIEYMPGTPPPAALPLTPLPQYYLDQQQTILQDWEDITGQHEVSKGQAPPGVTAGTAISFLQEQDDNFRIAQYKSIEDGVQKCATQAVGLFIQYVDVPRMIKTIGADGAFDTLKLKGSDIASGTDIRIEKGSSIGQSQAAKQARVMDMFSVGLLDQPLALKMLEVGGVQKVLDIMSVAEKKAQRENMKMKELDEETIDEHRQEFIGQIVEQIPELEEQIGSPEFEEQVDKFIPSVIEVADFDVHEQHIETHNLFRMSQEFETLEPVVQKQFEKHVNGHMSLLMQAQIQQMMGLGPEAAPPEEAEDTLGGDTNDESMPDEGPQPGTMAPNGAAPDMAPQEGGF